MASPKFLADLATWKRGRPEWAAMTEAIKSDDSPDLVRELADDAGATGNEVADLRNCRARALRPHVSSSQARDSAGARAAPRR